MYEELIGRLKRYSAKCITDRLDQDFAVAVGEAADAIEKLSAYVRQIEELRKDGYYLQKTKMMTYGQATMTEPLPKPPKEET